MSLLWFDGFQDPILVSKPEWDGAAAWNAAVTGRDGLANSAARAPSSTTTFKTVTLPSAAATVIYGLAFNAGNGSNFGNTGSGNFTFGGIMVGATVQMVLTLSATGFIEVRRGTTVTGTLLVTSSGHTPIGLSEWHSIEVKAVMDTSAGSVTVKLDGAQVATFSGVTAASSGSVSALRFGSGVIGTSNLVYDDMYVADAVDATATQGLPNNDFFGDLRVQTLFPTATGDQADWSPSSAVANWTTVDENPANTTDFVSDTVTGHRDLYNVTDLSGTINAVLGVRESLYATKTDAGAALVKPSIKENSTVTSDAAQGLSLGSWLPICGPFYWRKPSASTVWTAADVNALQIGQEVG